MKIHGFQLQEGSAIKNMTVDSGSTFPSQPDVGELFFITDAADGDQGLFVYTGVSWKSLDPSSLALQNHSSTHSPEGKDALPTAAAVGLSPASTNSAGVSNALSRADHTHELTGVQPSTPELTSIISQASHGLAVRTADGTWNIRELVAPTTGLSIDNANGVLGNPSLRLTDDLAALEALSGTGFAVRTGNSTWAQRSIAGADGDVAVSNGDGLLGNPTISLKTTGIVADTYVSLTVDSKGRAVSGAKTQPWSTISNTPTTLSGYGITDAQALDADLTAIAGLNSNGILVRTGTNSWSLRTLSSTTLSVVNGDGVAGNTTVNLPTVGAAATYSRVTTDAYGRVTSGTLPSGTAGQRTAVSIPAATTTSVIPFDNTTPTSTEGALLTSITMTPASANSTFDGVIAVTVDTANNARNVTITIFRGTTLVGMGVTNNTTAGRPQSLSVTFFDAPATTSDVTYNVRVGQNTSGTTYINTVGNASFGNAAKSAFIVSETL